MRIDVLTLFPEMFDSPFSASLMKKAQEKGLLDLNITNIRDFTEDKHKTADDSPYGGGAGMVMKPEPLFKAVASCGLRVAGYKPRLILMCPAGEKLTQEKAKELSNEKHLIILCGHYEGIDERVRTELITDEISIGDYVLTGGEIPAMALIDAVVRLIPGVVKEEESLINESFYSSLLDYPSYTKPEEYEGKKIPEVLKSGHHEEIAKWRRKESLKKTLFRRPELLAKADIKAEDRTLLAEIING